MPKSSKRSKSSSKDRSKKDKKKETPPPEEELVEESPVVQETKVETKVETKTKSKSKSKVPVEEPVTETPSEDQETSDEGLKRVRRVVTKESILADFDQLLKDLEEEVEALRNADSKTRKSKGVKFMRSVVKRVKGLRSDSGRVMKTRKQSNRPKNTSSGFMKPVQISPEMAKFTGWQPDVPRSRVDVTKYLCQYIRDKNLQFPEDRRIIKPDDKLSALLKLQDNDGEKNPLTYYSLQKSIQHHFTNDKSVTA